MLSSCPPPRGRCSQCRARPHTADPSARVGEGQGLEVGVCRAAGDLHRDRPPRLDNPEEIDPLRRLRKTLRQHYRIKRRHYGVDYPNFYDRDLRRLFSDAPEFAGNTTAAQFIGRIRRATRRAVAEWTGIYQYTIDQVIEDMIARSRELKLRLAVPEDQARQEFTVLLTVQTMNHLHSGGHRLFL